MPKDMNSEMAKYLTRIDLFRLVIKKSSNPKTTLINLMGSAMSNEELLESSERMNISPTQFTINFIKYAVDEFEGK